MQQKDTQKIQEQTRLNVKGDPLVQKTEISPY